MPLRFYRRFRAGPFRLNFSKSGMSYSFGGRHAWLTFGHGRACPRQTSMPAPILPAPNAIQWIAIVVIIGAALFVTGASTAQLNRLIVAGSGGRCT
jgi:hypothetical protein